MNIYFAVAIIQKNITKELNFSQKKTNLADENSKTIPTKYKKPIKCMDSGRGLVPASS